MKTNYFDKNGNYINVENLSLADIYHRAFAFGVESVDVRPQGKWIDHSEDYGYVECPFCHELTSCSDNADELHYCWNCGAEMRKGDKL